MAKVISWFEIPVTNFERARSFYQTILDIEIPAENVLGFMMGFFPMVNNSPTGAIVKGDGYIPSNNGTVLYLDAGEDLNIALSKVEKAGGKVIVPKTMITEDHGYFAFIFDTEGNKIGFHSNH
ncbi:MAG: VOC family protein [Lentimicrobiaceae bacterium]|jgi:hypothetical protein|nr:VOC family protein [Lentimicrobiaceae bacterium]